MNKNWKKWFVYVGVILFTFHFSLFISSCSDDSSDDDGEYDNWVERNDAVIDQWASGSYVKYKSYAKDQNSVGQPSDYVYVKVVESGSGTESPLYNDTIRVAYRLRYIPTDSYEEGYVVSETYSGEFSWQTISVQNFQLGSSLIDGFTTAVLNMHVGDRWIVNIPYPIAYGNPSSRSDIDDASNLVYDLALVDFWHPGETRPPFKARQMTIGN